MVLGNLFFLSETLILKGKAFIILTTFFTPLAIRTLHVEMPAVPFLKPSAVEKQVLFWLLLFLESYWGHNLACKQVCKVYICEKGVLLDLFSASTIAQSFLRVDFE